jgi:GATA-binding protein, other eukaryote
LTRADHLSGLYYKLHGVYRPVAMKKSVIKRRKRVVPAAQGAQALGFDVSNSNTESPESDGPSPRSEIHDRGTTNPDGSINLGFRPRPGPRLLPEPLSTLRNRDGPSDLTVYVSHPQGFAGDPCSLSDENRLPPIAAYQSPKPRPPSLSPSSFLSPTRKRSFSSAETESLTSPSEQNPKRLSSIKSILNPSQPPSQAEAALDPSLRPPRSPGPRYANAPSPNSYASSPVGSAAHPASAPRSAQDPSTEPDRAKLERRAELQREAEKMRAALAAKERELAELNA